MQSHPDQSGTTEDHVDSDQKSHRPGRSPRKIENNDAPQHNVDDAACNHPGPAPGELTSVFDGEHDGRATFDQEEQDQNEPQWAGRIEWPAKQPAVQFMSFVCDQDHADEDREQSRYQGPPEPRRVPRPKVVANPMAPLTRNSQPNATVTYDVAIDGTMIARRPSPTRAAPSARKAFPSPCLDCAILMNRPSLGFWFSFQQTPQAALDASQPAGRAIAPVVATASAVVRPIQTEASCHSPLTFRS